MDKEWTKWTLVDAAQEKKALPRLPFSPFSFCLFLFFFFSCAASIPRPSSSALSKEEAQKIGERIWQNECGSKEEGLIVWNEGEEFPSLGIGHFIWYPKGKKGPFTETFPSLLAFLQENGMILPLWLKQASGAPWSSREEFIKDLYSSRVVSLRKLLANTKDWQALFLAGRLERALPEMTKELSEKEKEYVKHQFERIKKESHGLYVLLDYLNFKGEGTSKTERYQGEGWGLLQVLLAMPSSGNPFDAFAGAAKQVLERRVLNAPVERKEGRFLKGWLARVNTYRIKE